MVSLLHSSRLLRVGVDSLEEIVEAAAGVLLSGGIVALPTDTLYGITTTLSHSERLYALKRRSHAKPLGIFVSGPADVATVAKSCVDSRLLSRLLPGPVTLLFHRHNLPSEFNHGVDRVGVRVPDSPLVSALVARCGQPLAQTSANVSGSTTNPCKISDFCDLLPEIDLVIDGGQIPAGEGSTIVDLTEADRGVYSIIRDGCALEQTESVLLEEGLRRQQKEF